MKAVVAAINQEKALVGAFSVITNLRIAFFWSTSCHQLQLQQHRLDAAAGAAAPSYGLIETLLMISTIYY